MDNIVEMEEVNELDEIKQFSVIVRCIKEIMSDINKGVDIDRNIYYELAFNRLKLDRLSKDSTNKHIKSECSSLISTIDILLDNVSDDELVVYDYSKLHDMRKYDNIKYENQKTLFDGHLREIEYRRITNISGYLTKRTIKFVISMLAFIVTCILPINFLEKAWIIAISAIFMGCQLIELCILATMLWSERGSGVIADKAQDTITNNHSMETVCEYVTDTLGSSNKSVLKSINHRNRFIRNGRILDYVSKTNKGNKKIKELKQRMKRLRDYSTEIQMCQEMAIIEYELDELYKRGELDVYEVYTQVEKTEEES